MPELIVILIVILLLFGAKKSPNSCVVPARVSAPSRTG